MLPCVLEENTSVLIHGCSFSDSGVHVQMYEQTMFCGSQVVTCGKNLCMRSMHAVGTVK